MKVGFVGLGAMGSAIASNILRAGHDLTVYNRSVEKTAALVSAGAKLAKTPAEAAKGDLVLSMVLDDSALEHILFGAQSDEKGLIHGQGEETIHLSMSTISVQLMQRMESEYKKAGKLLLATPVMGRPDVAQRGELVVLAAGAEKLIERCQPIFSAIGSKVIVLGSVPHQATVVKIAANFMISSMIETFGEAVALVRKADVSAKQFCDFASNDFFRSPVYEKYSKIIVDGKFDTGAFTVKAQAKDTRLAISAAQQMNCPMPFASVLNDTFITAIARGKGDLDPCSIAQLIAENAGLE